MALLASLSAQQTGASSSSNSNSKSTKTTTTTTTSDGNNGINWHNVRGESKTKRSKSLSTAVGHHSHYSSIHCELLFLSLFSCRMSLVARSSRQQSWRVKCTDQPTNQPTKHTETVGQNASYSVPLATAALLSHFACRTQKLPFPAKRTQHRLKWGKLSGKNETCTLFTSSNQRWHWSKAFTAANGARERERTKKIAINKVDARVAWERNWMMPMAPLKQLQAAQCLAECCLPSPSSWVLEVQCAANYRRLDNGCKMYSPKYCWKW